MTTEVQRGETAHERTTLQPAPGTERPVRFRPRLRYELIGCGLHGHELLGTDAARLRPEDRLFAWEDTAGSRWFRCLRCDAWLPLMPPEHPLVDHPPERDEVDLPLRGRPLRDRFVLRAIAVERACHVLVLGALTVAVFAFATHRSLLHHDYTRILAALQAAFGGPVARSGWASDVDRLFRFSTAEIYGAGAALAAYTGILALEMVGLWRARRWAEYLTFVEAGLLVPFEIYELAHSVSALKVLSLALNLLVLLYLLIAHRLFGIRGGRAAEAALHERDVGWAPLERATPASLLAAAAEGWDRPLGAGSARGGEPAARR